MAVTRPNFQEIKENALAGKITPENAINQASYFIFSFLKARDDSKEDESLRDPILFGAIRKGDTELVKTLVSAARGFLRRERQRRCYTTELTGKN